MRGTSHLSTVEKVTLVRRFEAGERASALALEAGVLSKSLYQWRAEYLAWVLAGLDRRAVQRSVLNFIAKIDLRPPRAAAKRS